MWVRAVMKGRLLWKSGILLNFCRLCQFERCDPFNNHRSGKMPMSIGITILTGSNAQMMITQVNIYLCVGYTEKDESCFEIPR